MRSRLGKIHRENTPFLVMSQQSIELDGHILLTSQSFFLFDIKGTDRIIAYSSDFRMEILGLSTQWHVDDNFK